MPSVVESSASHSDFDETRNKTTRKRQLRAEKGYMVSDTEEDDNIVDHDLANDVDSDSDSPNALRDMPANSRSNKGKLKSPLKSPLKRGPLSDEGKEEIHDFSSCVLEMAQDLADRFQISRKTVLIRASLGIKESRGENVANMHARWYAGTHTKPDGSAYSCAYFLPF